MVIRISLEDIILNFIYLNFKSKYSHQYLNQSYQIHYSQAKWNSNLFGNFR